MTTETAAARAAASATPAARPRRIALVTETYPPEINGVAMSVARLVDGLGARGHELQLVRPRQREADAPSRRPRFDEVLTGGWPIPGYPGLRMGTPSTGLLARRWRTWRPDVVHIATEGPLGWSAQRAAASLGLPVTSDFRTNFHVYGRHYGMGLLARPIESYLRRFHNRTSFTMVPTEPLRAQLSAGGFERLVVVSRGVDTRLFDPARRSASLRREWGVDDAALVVAYVGRLAPEKNLETVVRAYRAVRESVATARMLFVGSGPMRDELAALCPDATFAGQRRGEDLAAHYASADLFLFPSLTETFGNVTIEAMASGLPVVAFDCAAAGELIETHRNGVLVPGGDPDAFARAARGVALDPRRRVWLGHAARRTARGFDWSDVVERFESVLVGAIERRELAAMPAPASGRLAPSAARPTD